MKAQPVKGLKPGGTLADNLERIVRVRSEELHAFMPRAADPNKVKALHDMRIAAKRLRYILEISDGCFGPYAAQAGKRAKELQDLLGEIHDCDVTIPRVEELALELRATDVDAVVARAEGAQDLDPALAADPPHAAEHRGLQSLITYLAARRRVLFEAFSELWLELSREGFRARLEFAIAERPAPPEPEPEGEDAAVLEPEVVVAEPGSEVVAEPAFTPASPAEQPEVLASELSDA